MEHDMYVLSKKKCKILGYNQQFGILRRYLYMVHKSLSGYDDGIEIHSERWRDSVEYANRKIKKNEIIKK